MSLAVQKQAAFFSATRRAVAPRAAARAVRVMAQLSQDELKKQVGGAMGLPARRGAAERGRGVGGRRRRCRPRASVVGLPQAAPRLGY